MTRRADHHMTARALPALALATSAATALSLLVCLDALVCHEVPWEVKSLAFVGATIGMTSGIRAFAQLTVLVRASLGLRRGLSAARALPGRPGVLVVDDPRPRAWCAGLMRPQIALTEAALRELPPDGLDAVIAHERHHARRRDGLRRGLADVVAAGLFLLPGATRAGERYGAVLELDADRAAASADGGERGLAAAMLALDAPGRGVDPERVDRLLGRPVHVRVAGRTLTWAILLLVALSATAVVCTVTTGCVDIFLLKERDATASHTWILPLLVLSAGLIAANARPTWPHRGLPRPELT